MPSVNENGTAQIARMPQSDLEAEKSVLGSMLLLREAIDEAAGILASDDFYQHAHGLMFRALVDMHADGLAIDPVTLADRLSLIGRLEDCGGYQYLHEILEAVPHAGHVVHYSDIVREKALLRAVVQASTESIRESFDGSRAVSDVIGAAEQRIQAISERVAGPAERSSIRDIVVDCLSRVGAAVEEGVHSGISGLDAITHGFQKGHLIILAARPSVGKTAIACNLALHAGRNGVRVLFVSLEQPRLELAERLIAIESRIDSHALRGGLVDELQRRMVMEASERLGAMTISIDDEPGQTVTAHRGPRTPCETEGGHPNRLHRLPADHRARRYTGEQGAAGGLDDPTAQEPGTLTQHPDRAVGAA